MTDLETNRYPHVKRFAREAIQSDSTEATAAVQTRDARTLFHRRPGDWRPPFFDGRQRSRIVADPEIDPCRSPRRLTMRFRTANDEHPYLRRMCQGSKEGIMAAPSP
jgi:hypothetical protein